MKYLYFLILGKIEEKLLKRLAKDLQERFDFPTKIIKDVKLPSYAYNSERNQFEGEKILRELDRLEFPDAQRVLGIVDVDLYSDDLNFIFGQAEVLGRNCLISVYRLDPRFYKEKYLEKIFYIRILKEAMHELGHTFGLGHCPEKTCVMHYSNTLEDTDYKEDRFCKRCNKLYKLNIS